MKKRLLIAILCSFVLFSIAAQSTKDYTIFLNIVKKELKEIHIQNYEEHFNEQYFIIKEKNDYFDIGTEVGLTNLYNVCVQNDKSQWKSIIKDYFSQIKKGRAEEKEILPKLEKIETAKEYLRIRLYPIDYKKKISQSSITDCSTDDYIGVVVIDFPSAVKALSNEYIKKWSITEKEILKIAKENGLKTINGLDMLIEQALKTDEILYGILLSTQLRKKIRKKIKKKVEEYYENNGN
mgnify:CR=1 FL=1